jgi:hypothetical protein
MSVFLINRFVYYINTVLPVIADTYSVPIGGEGEPLNVID